jgi:hypothetical protein
VVVSVTQYALPRLVMNVRVGSGVGHGQQEGLLVPELEVLVGKLLAVDGLATGALRRVSLSIFNVSCHGTHIATGKVPALEHEVGNDAVELGVGIAKALLAGREGAEVLYRLGDDIVKELKVDATLLCCGSVLAMGGGWRD